MSKYKYEHPYEWLREYVSNIKDEQTLKSIIFSLMSKCDGDMIQDIFQNEMDNDGYFDEIITIRELCRNNSELLTFDYKWQDSKNYKPLSEALEDIGYELIDKDIEGEYNDIKGYYECEVKII